MATKLDYYEILGVSKNATDAEVKSAYRNLARKHHPDIDKTSGAENRFKEINEAYQVLADSKKRQAYDQFGHAAFSQGFGQRRSGDWQQATGNSSYRTYSWGSNQGFDFDFSGFADPFDIFEMVFGSASPFGRANRQPRYVLPIDFMEAIKGCEKEVEVSGRRQKIKVPAGVEDGTEIAFSEFVIVTQVSQHPTFRRQGYDIFVDLEIDYTQVTLGDTLKIPTVNGPVKIRIKPGTQPDTQIRLTGQGVPKLRGSGRGDQYVRIKVTIPTTLKKEQKELLEKLKQLSN